MRNFVIAIVKTGSGTIASLFLGVLSTKLIAYYLGPAGVGTYSIVKQSITTLTFFGVGSQTAVVQGIAIREKDDQDIYIRTAFWLYVIGSLVSLVVIYLGYEYVIHFQVTGDLRKISDEILWIALPVVVSNFYLFFKSVINGKRAIGWLAIVELIGPLVILISAYPVCIYFKSNQVIAFVLTMLLSQILMLGVSVKFLISKMYLPSLFNSVRLLIDHASSIEFLKIAILSVLATLISTGALFIVRVVIASQYGISTAGIFDLAWTVSGAYVMLLLGSFGTYYLPTLSEDKEKSSRSILIKRVFRLSIVASTLLITVVIVFKPMIVSLLYTQEFMPSINILRWMLIGDYFKVTAWVFAIPAIARGSLNVYLKTEILWWLSFVSITVVCAFLKVNIEYLGFAFAVLYIPLLYYYLQHIKYDHDVKLNKNQWLFWLAGLVCVITVSIVNWNLREVSFVLSLLSLCAVILVLFCFIDSEERAGVTSILAKLKNNFSSYGW